MLFQNKENLAAKVHQLHLVVGRKSERSKDLCCYSIILCEKITPIKGRMTLSECSQCRMCGKEFKGKKCLLKHEAQHLNDLGLANAEKLGQMGPPLASVEAGQQEDSQYRCRYVHSKALDSSFKIDPRIYPSSKVRIGIGGKPRDSYGLKRSTILLSLVRVLGVKGGSSLLYLLAQNTVHWSLRVLEGRVCNGLNGSSKSSNFS